MTPEELTPYIVLAVFYGVFFCIGWGVAIITRWSKILTFLVILGVAFVLLNKSVFKELLQHNFRHPILYVLLGIAWGYFRNPRLRYRYNFSAIDIFITPFRIIKILLHLLFVKIPVFTIRLIYWLFHIFKTLSSKDGWKNLFWGLWQWLIYLIPEEIKFEWYSTFGRGKTHKTHSKTSYEEKTHDRTRTSREKEQEKEERKRQQYQQYEQERRRREQQKAEEQAPRAKQAEEKADQKAKEQKQKADDRKNAKYFAEAGWDMSDFPAENKRFLNKNSSSYDILGVTPNMNRDEIKKAWKQLSKKYHPYTAPRFPIAVQRRATKITQAINGAKEKLVGKN